MRNLVLRSLLGALAIVGIVVSVMALMVHYDVTIVLVRHGIFYIPRIDPAAAPPCAVSEHWDCGTVNHSRFAVFPPRTFDEDPASKKLHIPIAAFGIAGYTAMLVLALFGRFWVLLQLAEIGFAAACFLSYLEAFVLEKWCIYCVWSQSIVTAILLTTIVALILRRRAVRVFSVKVDAG